jgi:predicted GNAT family acetyltransferase
MAEHDGQPAGFALYFFNYSTWVGRPGIYLEDLFVEPELRGLGIGKALLQRVAAVAVENGCQRLQWSVLDWNTPSIDFYRAMGGDFLDEWRNVRVSGEALKRLAGNSRPDKDLLGAPVILSEAQRSRRTCVSSSGERVGDQKAQSSPESSEAAQ